ncbi:hypothetical protein ACSTS3_06955 [Aquimarina muelleri]|uniref:hypothetical protein n=1 Tax=Aquimarina muelleri TaxID=279356 RepID=UPI003F68840F
MNATKINELKEKFEMVYPEYARTLSEASSDEERYVIHDELMKEAKTKIKDAYKKLDLELKKKEVNELFKTVDAKHNEAGIKELITKLKRDIAKSSTDETVPVVLKPQLLASLVEASGDQIETEVQKMLDGLERLSNMTDDDAIAVSLEIIGFSAVAIGTIAGAVTLYQLITLSGYFTVSTVVAGVVAATVAVVIAIAAFIALCIFLPFLYFMKKPAMCIVFLINELDGGPGLDDNAIDFVDSYNRSGKPTLLTSPVPGAYISEYGTYAYGGLYATSKRDDALLGTSFGMEFKCSYGVSGPGETKEKDNVTFAIGVENPLTSIYGGNNCYCEFDISAKEAADMTNKNNALTWSASNSLGLKLSIKCNSKGGSVAYYIARLYK